MASSLPLAIWHRGDSTVNLPPGGLVDGKLPSHPHYHPSPSQNEVAIVQPVLVNAFGADLMTDVKVVSSAVVTANKGGLVKCWGETIAYQERVTSHIGCAYWAQSRCVQMDRSTLV